MPLHTQLCNGKDEGEWKGGREGGREESESSMAILTEHSQDDVTGIYYYTCL